MASPPQSAREAGPALAVVGTTPAVPVVSAQPSTTTALPTPSPGAPPSTGPTPPAPRGLSRHPWRAVGVALLCVAVMVAALVWVNDRSQHPEAASGASRATAADAAPSAQQQSAAPVDPEQAALTALSGLRAQSMEGLTLDDRWVAQVASKAVGTVDPLQTAANGSHTYYATDILAESQSLTAKAPGHTLVLLSTDFGKRSTAPDGSPYWITLVDIGFSDSASVLAWCDQEFAGLTEEQIADSCAPRRMNAPHD